MKRSMIAGTIAGIGTVLMVVAGSRTQGFDWNDVMFIVGTACLTFGAIHLAQILEEVLRDEEAYDHNRADSSDMDVPVVRPFNLPNSQGRRGA